MTWVMIMAPAPWYAIEEPIPCAGCGYPAGRLYWQGDRWLCFLCRGSSSEAVGMTDWRGDRNYSDNEH